MEQDEEEGGREDYEGEDEYEDELKAVAESHEAMSRDDTRNLNASTATSSRLVDGTSIVASKNFDSHEVINANNSDEDVASNEAITNEVVDEEVSAFLFYFNPLEIIKSKNFLGILKKILYLLIMDHRFFLRVAKKKTL